MLLISFSLSSGELREGERGEGKKRGGASGANGLRENCGEKGKWERGKGRGIIIIVIIVN